MFVYSLHAKPLLLVIPALAVVSQGGFVEQASGDFTALGRDMSGPEPSTV